MVNIDLLLLQQKVREIESNNKEKTEKLETELKEKEKENDELKKYIATVEAKEKEHFMILRDLAHDNIERHLRIDDTLNEQNKINEKTKNDIKNLGGNINSFSGRVFLLSYLITRNDINKSIVKEEEIKKTRPEKYPRLTEEEQEKIHKEILPEKGNESEYKQIRKRGKKRKWTKKEDAILINNFKTQSVSKLAKYLQRTQNAVRHRYYDLKTKNNMHKV